MYSAFGDCRRITTLDLSSFDTSRVADMRNLFYKCYALTTIWASDTFVTDNVTTSGGIFSYCSALVGGNGTPIRRATTASPEQPDAGEMPDADGAEAETTDGEPESDGEQGGNDSDAAQDEAPSVEDEEIPEEAPDNDGETVPEDSNEEGSGETDTDTPDVVPEDEETETGMIESDPEPEETAEDAAPDETGDTIP